MTKREIKTLYQSIGDKEAFREDACQCFGIKPQSLETNWISKGYIPDNDRKKFIALLTIHANKKVA